MKHPPFLAPRYSLFVFLALTATPDVVFAAPAAGGGVLSGQVSNAATRAVLEGASVRLIATSWQTLTDTTGRFQFEDLPAGNYTVTVEYTGLDPQSREVALAAPGRATVDFALTSEIYRMEAVTVSGEREGNALSITRQRHADNVVNVVATDAYGSIADGNIGNFMQRLPGVGVLFEMGDVIGFGVRGTPSEMNAVNLDGVRASSAVAGSTPQGDRAVIIDSIPAEFIKEIELIKAPTPDSPADSVGGTANLVTKSALDVKGSLLTFRAGMNQNTYRREERDWTPTGAFSYVTKVGRNEQVGVALSGSYTESTNARDRLQMTRNQIDGRNTQARTLNDIATRARAGGGVKFNLRPNDGTELYAGVQYTYFSFQLIREDWNITAPNVNVADYSVMSRSRIETGTAPRTTANAAAGVAPGYTDAYTEILHATFTNTNAGTARHSRNYKYDLGGTRRFAGEQKVKVTASYSPSNYKWAFQSMEARRAGGVGLAIDATRNRDRPLYLQTYGPSLEAGGSLSGYTASRLLNYEYAEEEVSHLGLDYEKKVRGSLLQWELKSGLNWRRQYRNLESYNPRWNYVGADGVAGSVDDNLAQFRHPEPGYGMFNGQYPRRDRFDYPKFLRYFEANPGHFREQGTTVSVGPTYREITEDVYAGFAMARMKWRQLGGVAGVRWEQVDVAATGRLTDPRNAGTTRATRETTLREAFPSVHLRYEPLGGLLLRASYSTSYARPAFGQLYPITTVTYNDATGLGRVTQNNPAIKPQFSRNYDASVEYYFEPVGVLSAGVFEKRIRDFISAETRTIGMGADNGFDGQYEGFDWVTNRNFGSATIKGYELNYNQQLRMLPRPLNTLAIFANHTVLETSGDYGNGTDELVRFIPKTTNAGFSWRYARIELRAAYNFKDAFLRTYNINPWPRQREGAVETWDFNVKCRLTARLTGFVDVVNAFNKWASWYTGTDRGRVIMSEVYGTRLSAGVSGRF